MLHTLLVFTMSFIQFKEDRFRERCLLYIIYTTSGKYTQTFKPEYLICFTADYNQATSKLLIYSPETPQDKL